MANIEEEDFKVTFEIRYEFNSDLRLFMADVLISVPIDDEKLNSKFQCQAPLCGVTFDASWGDFDAETNSLFMCEHFNNSKSWEALKQEIYLYRNMVYREAKHIAHTYHEGIFTPPNNEVTKWVFGSKIPF